MNVYGLVLASVIVWWSFIRPAQALAEYKDQERKLQAFAELRDLDEEICASMNYTNCCDCH